MPGGWAFGPNVCRGQDTVGASNASVLTFPTPGNGSKGAWSQLLASTPFDSGLLEVHYKGFNSTATYVSFDIGVGASNSEQVLVNNIACYLNGTTNYSNLLIPVEIPVATRISVRAQTGVAANFQVGVSVALYDTGITNGAAFAGVDAIGWSGTASTTLTPALSSAFGSWTQIIAATARDYAALAVAVGEQNTPDATNFPDVTVQVGIGASGQEQIIIPSQSFAGGQKEDRLYGFKAVQIPKGSRLAARAGVNTAASTNGCGVILYGLYQ